MKKEIKKFDKNNYLLMKLDKALQNKIFEDKNGETFHHKVSLTRDDIIGVRHMNVSKKGIMLVSSTETPVVKVVDLNDFGKYLYAYNGHQRSVRNTCFNSKEDIFFSGSWDKTVHMVNLKTGKLIREFKDPLNMGRIPWISYYEENNNKTLFVGNYTKDVNPIKNNTINVFDVNTGNLIRQIAEHGHCISTESIALAVDFKNKYIYSGSDDGKILRFEMGGSWQKTKEYLGHTRSIRMLHLFNDNKYLASASTDRSIKIFDVESKELIAEYKNFLQDVMAVKVTADNKKLVTVSFDRSIRVFELPQLKPLSIINGVYGALWYCCFAFNDNVLLTGGDAGVVSFFAMNSYKQICNYYLMRCPDDYLWASPPDNNGKSCFYTNKPHKYIKVYKKKHNMESVDATPEEAENYYKQYNNADWLSRITHPDYFFDLMKKNNDNEQLGFTDRLLLE